MLDLLTAGTLAALPLAIQSPLFERVRQLDPSTVPPLLPLLAEALKDAARAAALLDAARSSADRALTRATREGIRPVPWASTEYPPLLARIADPPPLLWCRGTAALLGLPTVAIVGSRAASPYGLEVAHQLAAELAATGVIVVSGLARGVDSAAHRGALTRGSTAAFLGSGADVIYPAEHATLAEEIGRRGALLTELPPGTPPRQYHFPRRNRLISGCSLAVVVVEASIRSGSLQTARLALEQGREVMAVPGTILGERNRGSHGLLRDGATLVEQASDILDELRLPWTASSADPDYAAEAPPDGLDPMPCGEALEFQALIEITQLSAGELLRALLRAEMAGRVVRTAGCRFLRVARPVVR
jgi:DNA processing protein